jgi:hypothetical protein
MVLNELALRSWCDWGLHVPDISEVGREVDDQCPTK